jgi:aminocarboxymuconate-semialdehyde decarboxylase
VTVRTIDIHAHVTPQSFFRAIEAGKDWHGIRSSEQAMLVPKTRWTPEERLADMNSLGVDVQVLSTNATFYNYDKDARTVTAMARECNDQVAQMVKDYPDRFAGFCILPMQDVKAAIAELERGTTRLGLKGAMIDDTVNGRTFDEPEFLPFWQAAEQLGAVIFFHQGSPTMVSYRSKRYHLPNTIGNLAERTVTFASLVFGGVIDRFPGLKICLAHGGGYVCFGIGRMDRGWQVRPEARIHIQQPPCAYLRKFYYDCLTHSEAALRFLIDTVGIDRVVFGTDWPFDMAIDWPVSWVLSLESLTQEEKEAILYNNLEKLLGI